MAQYDYDVPQKIKTFHEERNCAHEGCAISHPLVLTRDFSLISEHKRINATIMMFGSVISPTGSENTMLHGRQERKKARRIIDGSAICTAAYCIRGKRVCGDKFIAVLEVSESCTARHSANVASNPGISVYRPNRTIARLGKLGVNTNAKKLFLREYSEIIGDDDPSG